MDFDMVAKNTEVRAVDRKQGIINIGIILMPMLDN